MSVNETILEQWFTRTVQTYPKETVCFLATEKDPFRNPVGRALREGLTALLAEVLGEMDRTRIQSALDGIVHIRAVQDFTASEAVGFIFLLKPILRELMPEHDPVPLDTRVDEVALVAFDEYTRCREKVADIRVNESRRAIHAASALG